MKKLTFLIVPLLIFACDPCRDVDCKNGTCEEGTCVCEDGWEGTVCDEAIPCYGVNCGSNGTCVEGICICDDGWTGDFCDTEEAYCNNTCIYANDGVCDDGGPDALYMDCNCGTDCADCGPRSEAICANQPPAPDAAITIWTSMITFPCNTQQIDVYVDDELYGSLTDYFESSPECGENGTVFIPVVNGSHTVYAECNDGDAAWGGPIQVDAGTCLILELTNSEKSAGSQTLKKIR